MADDVVLVPVDAPTPVTDPELIRRLEAHAAKHGVDVLEVVLGIDTGADKSGTTVLAFVRSDGHIICHVPQPADDPSPEAWLRALVDMQDVMDERPARLS